MLGRILLTLYTSLPNRYFVISNRLTTEQIDLGTLGFIVGVYFVAVSILTPIEERRIAFCASLSRAWLLHRFKVNPDGTSLIQLIDTGDIEII